MNREPILKQSSRNIVAVAVTSASLALAGCGEESTNTDNQLGSRNTVTQTTSSKQECSGHLVSPKKYFNAANTANIEEDLDLLSRINAEGESARFRDLKTATGIIYDSYNDPQYAEAIVSANRSIRNPSLGTPTARQFLAQDVAPVPECGANDKTTKEVVARQRKNTVSIGKVLVAGLSKKYASQGADTAERGIQAIDRQLDTFADELR